MIASLITILLMTTLAPLMPGDHVRSVIVDGRQRSYLVHVPPAYDPSRPMPVVLVLHGAGMNAEMTVRFTGMNRKADEAGFIAVYPNGSGPAAARVWNSGGRAARWLDRRIDDVAFIRTVLDDVATVLHVNTRRVYATGMSNGAMMCYRLAAELSDRIAAIAPVAGTMLVEKPAPVHAVPVMHFHGTDDRLVPPQGSDSRVPPLLRFRSVDETIRTWCRINGCAETAMTSELPDRADDGTTVRRSHYLPRSGGADVVLFEIHGGGHTWPGQTPALQLLGRSTRDISANDLMWEFFRDHPLP